MSKDYYKILGVDKNATKDEIKKAFHKQAHKHHPDKNKGDDSKFKEANEAYQVLSDDQKRARYDQFGSADGPMGGGNYGGQGGFGGFGGFDFSGSNGGVEFDMGDLGDIFGDFFGGGMGRSRQKTKRGRDLSTEIYLSFEESIFGIDKKIKLNRQSPCDSCGGSGGKPGSKIDNCKVCNGSGQIKEVKRSILGNFSSVRVCDSCNGQGKIPVEKCSLCKGSGVYKKEQEINVKIPSGINNGETLRVSGYGEAIQGGQTGDLYIKINVRSHPIFKRDNLNLNMNLNVKLTDALLGTVYELKTLEGDTIEIKIPEGTNNNDLLRVRGRGVPSSRGRGDIIIHIELKMPSKLSRKVKEAIEELKKEGI